MLPDEDSPNFGEGHADEKWVEAGECWISEPSLWSADWTHVGVLSAAMDSTLLSMDVRQFCETARLYPSAEVMLSEYAIGFMAWLNDLEPEDRSDIITPQLNEVFEHFIPHTPGLRTATLP